MHGLIGQEMENQLAQGQANAVYQARSLREKLLDQKAGMEKRVKEIDEAIALLDRNPDFEKLQNLLSR